MAAVGQVEDGFSVTISEIEPLQSPLAAVQKLLDHLDNQGVIIGGVAASVLGTPRLTADVDAVLLLSVLDRARIARWVREFAVALELPSCGQILHRCSGKLRFCHSWRHSGRA